MTEHDVREGLRNVPVRIWSCVREDHRHVGWREDVAHCIEPGCGLTSEDTAPWLQMMNAEIAKAGAKALRDVADTIEREAQRTDRRFTEHDLADAGAVGYLRNLAALQS